MDCSGVFLNQFFRNNTKCCHPYESDSNSVRRLDKAVPQFFQKAWTFLVAMCQVPGEVALRLTRRVVLNGILLKM